MSCSLFREWNFELLCLLIHSTKAWLATQNLFALPVLMSVRKLNLDIDTYLCTCPEVCQRLNSKFESCLLLWPSVRCQASLKTWNSCTSWPKVDLKARLEICKWDLFACCRMNSDQKLWARTPIWSFQRTKRTSRADATQLGYTLTPGQISPWPWDTFLYPSLCSMKGPSGWCWRWDLFQCYSALHTYLCARQHWDGLWPLIFIEVWLSDGIIIKRRHDHDTDNVESLQILRIRHSILLAICKLQVSVHASWIVCTSCNTDSHVL